MTIGKKIKSLRKEAGLTQVQLAEKIGILQPHLNRWENDNASPSLDALKKLSRLFDISVDTLIFTDKDIEALKIKDKAMINKLKNIDKLNDSDKQMVINLIDSLSKKK